MVVSKSRSQKKSKEETVEVAEGSKTTWMDKWRKAFRREESWEREELMDILHYGRQLIGIICGLICGLWPVKGILAFVLYFAGTFGGMHLYLYKYLDVDEDVLEGAKTAQEGFVGSFALFLLLWIMLYTGLHTNT